MAKIRNQKLVASLTTVKPKVNLVASQSIPKPNTTNISGHSAYKVDKWLRLLFLLNTSKLQTQFYRTENETINEVRALVGDCAREDLYLTAQCIVYSRCVGEGMRTVNHLAATELSKYCAGAEWASRFYGLWNKFEQKGGTIFRPDDIAEIVGCYTAFNSYVADGKVRNVAITNAMKRGLKCAIENLDSYSLLKYKSSLIDVINIVHPNPSLSNAFVTYKGKRISTIKAIMEDLPVSADTHEVANSEAGQMVAESVKTGKLSKEEAVTVLSEAKADNWKGLLSDGKLPIMAALRNIRNILLNKPEMVTINMLTTLLGDVNKILQGKIMPYQIDMAHEVIMTEFNQPNSRTILKTLHDVYEAALPNLAEMLTGRTLVIVDFSVSMTRTITNANGDTKSRKSYHSSAMDKAALIAATIAKSTNGDIIRFGSGAEYVNYNPNQDVFSLANSIKRDMGSTELSAAWQCAARSGKVYDRVFILSDYECNVGSTYSAYKSYVEKIGDPWVYSVDLASYGTTAIAGPKVRYYYGYGFSMFEDIAKLEFSPSAHLDKVRQIVI